jgi:hypothetical protein
MKLKALFLALAVAGAGASFALADDGGGTTTTTATTTTSPAKGPKCPRFELKGTLSTVSAASLTMAVTKANDAAKSLVGQTATVALDAKTHVSWDGVGTLTGPNPGDGVVVHARQCGGSTGAITADSIKAKAVKTPHAPADKTAKPDSPKKK